MATRRSFWKWHRWKSIGFCLWPPSTCIWNLKLKFQSKLDLCSGNHVVYRQTDGQTVRRTDKVNPVYPPPTSLGGGIIMKKSLTLSVPEPVIFRLRQNNVQPTPLSTPSYFTECLTWLPVAGLTLSRFVINNLRFLPSIAICTDGYCRRSLRPSVRLRYGKWCHMYTACYHWNLRDWLRKITRHFWY